MTAKRGLVGAVALLAVLAVSLGLSVVLLSSLSDPRPILVYDAGQLVSTVPTTGVAVPGAVTASSPGVVDPAWVNRTAASSGIPEVAVRAYATAAVRLG